MQSQGTSSHLVQLKHPIIWNKIDKYFQIESCLKLLLYLKLNILDWKMKSKIQFHLSHTKHLKQSNFIRNNHELFYLYYILKTILKHCFKSRKMFLFSFLKILFLFLHPIIQYCCWALLSFSVSYSVSSCLILSTKFNWDPGSSNPNPVLSAQTIYSTQHSELRKRLKLLNKTLPTRDNVPWDCFLKWQLKKLLLITKED